MKLDIITPHLVAELCGTTETNILIIMAKLQAGTPPFGLEMLPPDFTLDRQALIHFLDHFALECASDIALINVVKLASSNPITPEIIESDYLEALIKKRYARKQTPRYHNNAPKLRNANASSKADTFGRLYVFGCKEMNVIKIGYSINVQDRLKAVQTGYPYPLKILFISEPRKDVRKIEQQIHKTLRRFRLTGEWFSAVAYENIDWDKIQKL